MNKPNRDLYPPMEDSLKSFLPAGTRVLLACSGGPDSMALWDLLERYRSEHKIFLAVGHVNHQLRRASGTDAAFVQRQAQKRGTACFVKSVDVRAWAQKHKKGLEEAARFLRYQALAHVARRQRCSLVLTAHHLDDQAETFFMHLIRGAGPAGLGGMAPQSPWPLPGGKSLSLGRPLLTVSRQQIQAHLDAHRLPSRRDASNQDPAFFRNAIRPILQQWEKSRPGLLQRVAQTAALQRDEEGYWEGLLRPLEKGHFRRKGKTFYLDLKGFKSYHKALQRRLLRRCFGLAQFDSCERVRALALQTLPKAALPVPGGQVQKKGALLIFTQSQKKSPTALPPPKTPSSVCPLGIPGRARIHLNNGSRGRKWQISTGFVKKLPKNWTRLTRRVYLDADRLDPSSLRCRSWKQGDRFQPLGMKGQKKLQDFFVDQGVPQPQRGLVPIVEDRRGVVWVGGHRLADSVKLTDKTQRILELSLKPIS